MLTVPCPTCDKQLKIQPTMLGRNLVCPACKSVFKLDAPEDDLPAAEIIPAATMSQAKPPPKPRPVDDEDDDIIEDVVVVKSSRKSDFDVVDDDDDDYDEPVRKNKKPTPKRKVRRSSPTPDSDRNEGSANPFIGVCAIILGGMMFLGALLSVTNAKPDRNGNSNMYFAGLITGPGLCIYGFRRMSGG